MSEGRRVLLVTGGSRGIGAETARRAACAGWDVAVNYTRDDDAAAQVVDQVRERGRRSVAVRADVADHEAVLAMFETVDAELGPVTGLVNNAGIVAQASRLDSPDEMTPQRWQRMFAVNVIGLLDCCQQAVLRMSTAHGGPGGAIVNVSSGAATTGGAGTYIDYAASKGAVETVTVGLAKEVVAEGIRVNTVRPGIVDTGIHADSGDADRVAKVGPSLPMGRAGRPDEVAEAIVWLLSDAAGYTTGSVLPVTGGR